MENNNTLICRDKIIIYLFINYFLFIYFFMKKMFFYAAMATAVFASCRKDNNDIVAPSENAEKQPIQFTMGNAIELTTRGTGAVGDTLNGANVWRCEKLNVFMFDKGTLNLTQDLTTNSPYFDNLELTAGTEEECGTSNLVLGDYGDTKYYPGNGNFDFFAYHADDAVSGDYNVLENSYTVDVTINGTQDLMVAKAVMNAEDKERYLGNPTTKDPNCDRVYSAYAARRDIQPRFQFEHLLTRLKFHIIGADEGVNDPSYGVFIDSIVIKNTLSKGEMVVAYTGEKPNNLITWGDERSDFWLTQKAVSLGEGADVAQPTEKLESKLSPAKGDTVSLGESMLLCPSESYELVVYYSQYPDENSVINDREVVSFYPQTLSLKSGNSFEAGHQYNVYFKVYKAQRIEIQLELTAWETGEDVEVDSEEVYDNNENI